MEILQVIEETEAQKAYDKWELAAFHGWQRFQLKSSKKSRIKSFDQYRKAQGIRRPTEKIKSREDEIEAAKQVLADLGLSEFYGSI